MSHGLKLLVDRMHYDRKFIRHIYEPRRDSFNAGGQLQVVTAVQSRHRRLMKENLRLVELCFQNSKGTVHFGITRL